jgi:hypothetical protein
MAKIKQRDLLNEIFVSSFDSSKDDADIPYERLGQKRLSERVFISESVLLEKVFEYEKKVKEIKQIVSSIKRSLSTFKETAENCLSLFNRVVGLYNMIEENACTDMLRRELKERYTTLEYIITVTVDILKNRRFSI